VFDGWAVADCFFGFCDEVEEDNKVNQYQRNVEQVVPVD
jgi:hypothetical protein